MGTVFYTKPQEHWARESAFLSQPILNDILQKIIKLLGNWDKKNIYNNVIDEIDRDYFAELIAIQHIRHPNFIENHWNLHKDMNSKSIDIISSFLSMANQKFKNINKLNLEFDENYSSALHSSFILDEEWRYDIQEQLVKKIWIFFYTSDNVLTSDNPLLLKPHLKQKLSLYSGFWAEGVEIIFPINKNLILTILDEEYFSEQKDLHNTIQFLNDKKLREYNLYQYYFSNFEIYSAIHDFEIIKKFVELNNGMDYFPNRPKTNVY